MLSKETICVSVLKKVVLNSSLTSPLQGAKQRTKSITTRSDFDMFTLSRRHEMEGTNIINNCLHQLISRPGTDKAKSMSI